MSLSDLVGIPDWRSAVLALAFAAPWLILFVGSRIRHYPVWRALVLGALVFPFTLAWIQVPIQQAIDVLWFRSLSDDVTQKYLVLVRLPFKTSEVSYSNALRLRQGTA